MDALFAHILAVDVIEIDLDIDSISHVGTIPRTGHGFGGSQLLLELLGRSLAVRAGG